MEKTFNATREKYEHALIQEEDKKDMTPYSAEHMLKYGQSFLSYVDPSYVQDMSNN